MKKNLRRILDRLRGGARGGLRDGAFRKRTAVRGGLQEPQRVRALPAVTR